MQARRPAPQGSAAGQKAHTTGQDRLKDCPTIADEASVRPRPLAAALLAAAILCGGQTAPRRWKRTWIVSTAVMTAASLLDAHSSRGLYENNPVLRNGQGQFSTAKGYALKSAATVGVAFIQALATRKRPELYKSCVVVNSAAAGAFAVAAWRNREVRSSYRNLLGVGGGGQQSKAE